MQRYFGRKMHQHLLLEEDDIHHLLKVMRARKGDQIEVVADEKVYLSQIESIKPLSIVSLKEIKENNELPNYVILVASLLKGDKMDYVLQKATELGVNEVVLLVSERTIIHLKQKQNDLRLGRYQRILKEAAEQSKRRRIPYIQNIISFERIDEIDADLKLIAYEGSSGSTSLLNKKIDSLKNGKRIAIIIGPEGGFSVDEVNYARHHGFAPVGLGKRILRAETASIYALSVIANRLEDKND